MATSKSSATNGTNVKTAKEMQEWYEKNKRNIENFANAQDTWKQLRDVSKSTSVKNITKVTKENVAKYLQNPSSNEENLRDVSNYLYYRSHIYMRIIDFYSGMVMPHARTVIPEYDVSKDTDMTKNLKSYNETITTLDMMNLELYAKQIWMTVLKEDVFFGVYWLDDTGFTIINIPAKYGKIDGVYSTGNFSWSMDMSFFKSHKDYLEWWGEPFQSLYRAYENDKIKWKNIPPEYSVAFKFRVDEPTIAIPPFVGLFGKFTDLELMADLEAIQAEQNIYKLLALKIPLVSGSKDVDDFAVDVSLAKNYYDKLVNEALPDYSAAALLPGLDLDTIEFKDDAASQTSKYEKAMESILNTAGAAQVLCGSAINSTAAFNAAMIASERFALGTMLPQFSGWIAMVFNEHLSKPCKVKFHMVSPYRREQFMENLLTGSQYGAPDILTWNTMNEFSEKDTLALNALQTALNIPSKLVPVASSHTQSGEVGQGAPKKSDDELSESGDRSRNK